MTTYEVNVLAHLNRDFTIDADTDTDAARRVEEICDALYGEDLALADVQHAIPAEEQTIIGQSEVDVTALLADGTGIERTSVGDTGTEYLVLGWSNFVVDATLADVIIQTVDFPCAVQLDEMSDDGAGEVAAACEALGMNFEEASQIRDALAERVRGAIEHEVAAWRIEQGLAARP